MSLKQMLLSSLAAASVGVFTAAPAMAHDAIIVHNAGRPNAEGMTPKFAVIKHLNGNIHEPRTTAFPPTWTYNLVYSGKTYPETFVGTAVTGGASTTVPVYIIPIKMVYSTTSEDPTVVTANGVSIIQNVINSPVFAKTVDFKVNGVDFGTTQYVDAFQRSNLWSTVKTETGYHVLLGTPTVEKVQTITVAKGHGGTTTAFGVKVIYENINNYDASIQALITSLKIPSNALPLFITTQTFLTSGNTTSTCCIGGYHSVTNSNSQPYASSTYITASGAFAQNVSALSHEIGEWMTDPNINNAVPAACGSGAVLEVGDPLEGNTNYGDYAYTVGGVTWDLQDLAELGYFGATPNPSASGYNTFQGESLPFCSNGG